jgi:hypothetical protein
MELDPDFNEFFASLGRSNVRFLVVGGYAMAAHGHPRFTKDLDIWIWMEPSNSKAMIAALNDFGFGSLGISEEDFLTAGMVIQLGYPPQRIDLLTSPDGVDFEECWADRLVTSVNGREIPFIGLRGLADNKAASARAQDLADLVKLRPLLDGANE